MRISATIGRLTWATLVATLPVLPAQAEDVRYLVVRYDDYAPVTHYPRESSDTSVERRLFDIVERQEARIVVAVVPFPIADPSAAARDPRTSRATDSWLNDPSDPWVELLRASVDRGVVEPALHGFEHRKTVGPGRRPGEFRGRGYEWQRAAIQLGGAALSAALDRPVDVYVPPWNAWDEDTAGALEEAGFRWLSADLYHAELGGSKLTVVPQITADPRAILAWVQRGDAVPAGTIAVLVTHPFDFEGANGESYFLDVLELLAVVRASPDWRCVGLNDLPATQAAEWDGRFQKAVSYDHAEGLLGDALAAGRVFKTRPALFMPAEWYDRRLNAAWMGVGVTMLVSTLLGGVAAWFGLRLVLGSYRLVTRFAWIVGAIGLIVLVVGAVRVSMEGYRIRGVRWQAICAATGVTVAWLLVRRSARRPTE
jgi:predicted deacetylase